jgi:uncharacterized protein (TIGR03083 family)
MTTIEAWLAAVRRSHDTLASLVGKLDASTLTGPSACSEWTVAQVLSHLGSQAEIFSLFVDAGLAGGDPPSRDVFGPIWDAWNSRSPEAQAADSVTANEALVARLEGTDTAQLDGFRLDLFGHQVDAAGLLRMRLSEHAVHTWDVAVALDPSAEVAADAVELLIDGLGEMAGRTGQVPAQPLQATVTTTGPARHFALTAVDQVRLELTDNPVAGGSSIELPAEAFLRAVYGRLDDIHPPHGPVHADGVTITDLQSIFKGF